MTFDLGTVIPDTRSLREAIDRAEADACSSVVRSSAEMAAERQRAEQQRINDALYQGWLVKVAADAVVRKCGGRV